MWFKIKSFFNFLIISTNQHGVHSPFVYKLVTNCFYKKTNNHKLNLFFEVKKWLLTNTKTVTSKSKNDINTFKINNIKAQYTAKIKNISTKKIKLLIRFIEYFSPNSLLEIGTSVGLVTSAMAIANNSLKITTLESCSSTSLIAKKTFKQFNFTSIQLIEGNFSNTLNNTLFNQHFDIVYFGENYLKTSTLNYFNSCLKNINNKTIFIFDAIFLSKEMQENWDEIKEHPAVTVTINTYFWGIVFFRKEQKKQHFTIRI